MHLVLAEAVLNTSAVAVKSSKNVKINIVFCINYECFVLL